MNKNTILALAIGLIVGVGGTLGVNAITKDNDIGSVTKTEQQSLVTNHSTMSMSDMNKELENLSGDDYDKAFIEMMVAHHEGAVDMAMLSKTRAKHDEIKKLSLDIITAQKKEITAMKQWQSDWNYKTDDANQIMHSNH